MNNRAVCSIVVSFVCRSLSLQSDQPLLPLSACADLLQRSSTSAAAATTAAATAAANDDDEVQQSPRTATTPTITLTATTVAKRLLLHLAPVTPRTLLHRVHLSLRCCSSQQPCQQNELGGIGCVSFSRAFWISRCCTLQCARKNIRSYTLILMLAGRWRQQRRGKTVLRCCRMLMFSLR